MGDWFIPIKDPWYQHQHDLIPKIFPDGAQNAAPTARPVILNGCSILIQKGRLTLLVYKCM